MKVESMNLSQVRQTGLEVLNRELGAVATVRFLQQFEMGEGDYTLERHQWLDSLTLEQIVGQLQSDKIALK